MFTVAFPTGLLHTFHGGHQAGFHSESFIKPVKMKFIVHKGLHIFIFFLFRGSQSDFGDMTGMLIKAYKSLSLRAAGASSPATAHCSFICSPIHPFIHSISMMESLPHVDPATGLYKLLGVDACPSDTPNRMDRSLVDRLPIIQW